MNRPRILKEVKMKQLYILCAFLCFYLQSIEVKCNPFTAEFHSKYKVPASVPSDPTKLVYHVPVGHPMRRIIVNMKKLSKQFYGGFGDTFVSSFDVNHANESFNDTWAETGGYIGMFGLNSPFPYYYSHLGRRMYSSPTTTLKLTMFYGELLVENLVHYHPNMTKPPNPRIVSVNVRAAGQNIVIESEPIEFSDSIDRIAVVDFPSTVVANKPFNVSAELLTANGSRLTEGADSVLGVILRIAHIEGLTSMIWDYNVGQIALEEPVRLDGENIYMDLSSKVKASMKRATNGFVEFPNIRLLDVHSCVRLNFTSRSMEFPYPRMPFKTDDDKWVVKFNTSENYKGFYLDADHLNNGVVLTDCINVTAQTATTLVIKTQPAARLAANFPTEPAIVIEIQDADGDRVYSGPDSKLVISVYADPSNAVLCNDSMSVEASDGIAVFEGSFCEPIASVKLRFEATSSVNGSELTSVESTLMEITNELHIAFFGDVNVTGRSTYGPNSQAIIRLLVDKVNAGAHPFLAGILPGRKVFLSTYNTKLDRELTGSNFIKMIDKGKADPSQKVRAVIGFGQDDVSTSLQFLLKEYKMPLFTTIETNPIFSDKILFPYSNRMSFNYKNTVGYIMRLFRLRNWKKIVVLTTDTFYIDASFYKTCQDQDIEVADTVSIPTLDPSEMVPGAVDNYLKRVKNANTTIIVYMMIRPLTSYLFFETYRYHMSTLHGYQTSFAGDEVGTNGVPWINEDSVCFQGNMSCSLILTGMFAAYSYSNISAFLTPEWMWTLSNYIRMDPWDMYGIGRNFPPSSVFGLMSRAPDACRTIMLAVDKLIKENATITPEKMAITPRQMDAFTGLTGEIKFDEYGDRLGFLGEISTIYPYPWALNHVRMFAYSPYAVYYPYGVDDILEIRREVLIYWKSLGFSLQPKSYAWAAENHRNMRNYTTSTGIIKDYTFKLGEYGGQPLEIVTKNETVPAPFWCDQGCGGGDPDPFDITIYPYGTCENLNICRCKDGYFGYDCSQLICSCAHGHCDVPYVCICDEGYEGVKCETAICKTVNCGEHGTCSSPEVCICDSGYMGKNCDTLIVAVALGALFGSIAFIAIVVFIVFKIVKRMQLKAALSNLDWLVKWDEVMIGDARALSYLSTAADELMQSNKSNIVTWRSQKCFVQKFHCDNLELQDPLLRLEVVFMKELRHNNILTFVGACLDFPYVCVLTEVAPKGSLEDVLHNETINLGWDFRFSLLKDICRGMEFLHNSNIGSHGRLKTTNCLIDNRWTCKIGGYGVPTWRYKGPRRTIPNEEVTHRESELFWTAPELLTSNVHILDDVQNGTKAGDIYSFSVIMSEMCTREEPFSNELGFLTAQDIMKLLINKDSPEAADAKRLWYKSGGDTTKLFRPRVADDHLPTEYAAKTGMLKLFEMLWAANPSVRPTFRQTLDKLNEIYPIKGELIDNLINMLEKYSSNLEQIVAERTRDLVAEKAKTEQLLSQILPKKVMEDLKHGKPVIPESFECVTIYFSDIVGFTKIAGGSTPLQIVDLLNDLYTTFDAILDNYDVYKVETIGDAYMVVSGLPIRNGDLHAGEIATMSLDLLAAIGSFRIRHMPETTLQLRIGMHSGSCVAGVVGLKMPRYCLFGDTVNTASRMESNSMALRIHLSEPCFKILESLGGYHLVYRGQIEAKGKGKMTTYWLHGKDGFEKKLPDMTLAASASQHEFK